MLFLLANSFLSFHTERSQGMGLMQISSRIGSAASPWIAKSLKSVHKSVPFLVMGINSLIAAFLLFTLPETKGQRTAEVLENKYAVEVEMADRNQALEGDEAANYV